MKIQASNLTIIVKDLKPKQEDTSFTVQSKNYEEGEIESISPMIDDETLEVGKTLIYVKHEDNHFMGDDLTAVHYDYVIGVK